MSIKNFSGNYKGALIGKKVVLTGCTGGIGKELCRYILQLGAELVMVNRNKLKADELKKQLLNEYPTAKINGLIADMSDVLSVLSVTEHIKALAPDILIHNAGAYKIPREICSSGYDNVFTINFISPYLITRALKDIVSKVVVVGSIAHNYSKIDVNDIDFRTRVASSLVYGNAKRYLMFSHFELLKNNKNVSLAITHPGITLTGITDHYPKWIYPLMKPFMKIIFMKPKYAALSIIKGIFENTESYSWIGPAVFGIWGSPRKTALKTAGKQEIEEIAKKSEQIAVFVENMQKNLEKI